MNALRDVLPQATQVARTDIDAKRAYLLLRAEGQDEVIAALKHAAHDAADQLGLSCTL